MSVWINGTHLSTFIISLLYSMVTQGTSTSKDMLNASREYQFECDSACLSPSTWEAKAG